MLYFAFGSNMSPVQTPRRCPGARPLGPGRLDNWRLSITTIGGATIIKQRGCATFGVLWRFEPRHAALMDRWEGVSRGVYRRQWVRVEREGHGEVTALTYVRDTHYPGRPRAHYINSAMLVGACAFDLPEHYHDEIRAWLPRRPIGANQRYIGRRTPPRK